MKKRVEIRAERIKEFVEKYKYRGRGVEEAMRFYGYSRSTIYNYLKIAGE